jgi:hypothetical protein
MASPQTKPAAAPHQGDWQELARVLLDEADTSALTALAASHTPTEAGQTVRFGSASELLYRLQADFSVDRPHGPAGSGFHDGDLHRSVHFKTRQGGRFWSHLSLLALGLAGRDALRTLGGAESAATAALEERGLGMTRLLEAAMFSVVNLFAQSTILGEALTRLENDLGLLETEIAAAGQLTRAGLNTPGQTETDLQRRLHLLQVLLDQKFAQTDDNCADSLRLLRASQTPA